MPVGWMGKILDVDLTTRTTSIRDSMAYADDYIGGRALASRIAWDEIPAGIDAYDPQNRIIIATGPLAGTLAPTTGRTVMTSLSTRVYPKPWYTHSTLGGWFGPEMKFAGLDAIIIHGQADSPVYLEIQDDRTRLLDAEELWGMAPHFKLPCHADGTLIDEAGFSRLLNEYYAARGWDLEFGWPQADRLRELGLEELIPELDERRSYFDDDGN